MLTYGARSTENGEAGNPSRFPKLTSKVALPMSPSAAYRTAIGCETPGADTTTVCPSISASAGMKVFPSALRENPRKG